MVARSYSGVVMIETLAVPSGPGVLDLVRAFADMWNLQRRRKLMPSERPLLLEAPQSWVPNVRVQRHIPRLGMFPIRGLCIEAINQAGTLKREALIETIRSMSYKGIWNLYKFAAEPGPNAVSPNEILTGPFMEGFYFPMVQLVGGQRKVIWPLEFASAEFVSPPWLN